MNHTGLQSSTVAPGRAVLRFPALIFLCPHVPFHFYAHAAFRADLLMARVAIETSRRAPSRMRFRLRRRDGIHPGPASTPRVAVAAPQTPPARPSMWKSCPKRTAPRAPATTTTTPRPRVHMSPPPPTPTGDRRSCRQRRQRRQRRRRGVTHLFPHETSGARRKEAPKNRVQWRRHNKAPDRRS